MNKQDQGLSSVTMRDVAEAAGVSRMTVSRALRKNSSVSRETRERILKVVRDMNYVPDQMAGSLSTKKSGFVAVLLPSLNNLHFALTVQSLTEGLAESGMQILLGHTDYSTEKEEAVVETMLRRRPELIVLSYDGHTERTRQLLKESGVPVIEIWEKPSDPIGYTVGFSNKDAAHQMAQALVEQGYRNIVFMGEEDDEFTRGSARLAGFQQAMRENGLDANRVFRIGVPPLGIEVAAGAASSLIEAYPDADCVFCVSDMAAFGLISGLRELGKSVPEDIAVAGFGNFEVSRFASPTITTVEVDPIAIGAKTAEMICKILVSLEKSENNAASEMKNEHIPVSLIFRDSTQS